MRLGFLILIGTLAVLSLHTASLADEVVVSGYEDAFDTLRQQHNPNYKGASVEQAIKAMFEEGDVDKGTYLPSEYWKRDGDLRRKKPPSVRHQGQVFFKYSKDDISDTEKFEKETSFNLRYTDWSANFRFSDENVFAYKTDPFRWEKGNLRYKNKSTKVTVGSFGALFGWGLALNMFDDRTLDFDNEVEGVIVERELGDAELIVLTGTRKKFDDARGSKLSAARIELDLAKGVKVGLHTVETQFPGENYHQEDWQEVLDYKIYGTDVSLRSGPVRFNGEYVQLQRDASEYGTLDEDFTGRGGRGYYLNMGYSAPGVGFVAEYKDYKDIQQPFSILPPLRRYNEQAFADPRNDKGYAFELNWSPLDDGSLFTFDYGQGNKQEKNYPYTEFAAIYSSPSINDFTWVGEYWHVNIQEDKRDIQRLTLSKQLTSDWTTSSYMEREVFYGSLFSGHKDYIYEVELAYKSLANLAYTFQTSGVDGAEVSAWRILELKLKPNENQEINLNYGSRAEGYVCSGGVCRLEPAFDGVRIDYLRRF